MNSPVVPTAELIANIVVILTVGNLVTLVVGSFFWRLSGDLYHGFKALLRAGVRRVGRVEAAKPAPVSDFPRTRRSAAAPESVAL